MSKSLKEDMRKLPNITLLIILLLYVFCAAASLSRGHNWGDDFAAYIMQARSIVTGTEKTFIEQNSFTVLNSSVPFGPFAYPWGYPIILALFYAVFGVNVLALKIPNILLFVLFLIIFYKLVRKRLTEWESILLISIFAFNPYLIDFQNNLLSDIPFLFFSTLAILLIDGSIQESEHIPDSPVNNLILGIFIFLAAFIRTTGILLIPTLLVCHLIAIFLHRKKIKEHPRILVGYLIPYIVFGCLWLVSSIILPAGDSSYFLEFASFNFLGSLKGNLIYYFLLAQEFLTGATFPDVIYGFLLAFLMIGIIVRIKEDYLFMIYSVITIGTLFNWPSQQGLRFIFPILPFFIYFSFQGMKTALSEAIKQHHVFGTTLTYWFWIAMLLIFAVHSGQIVRANFAVDRQMEGPFDPYSQDMFKFVRNDTPSNSVIVFAKPRAMRLMTDRNAIMIYKCSELSRGDYTVIATNPDLAEFQVPINTLSSCGLSGTQVYEDQKFMVYKLNK